MTKPPTTRVNLDKAIERLFGTDVRSLMANAIIGQRRKTFRLNT